MRLTLSPEKIALLKNPTTEGALKFWNYDLLGKPMDDTVALAGVHRARLKWDGSTKAMIRESREWLQSHGYTV